MESPRALLARLPLLLRWVVVSAAIAGIAGALVGLVVGLRTYASTAWFAVVEVGLPATIFGALIGLVMGSFILVARRMASAIVMAPSASSAVCCYGRGRDMRSVGSAKYP